MLSGKTIDIAVEYGGNNPSLLVNSAYSVGALAPVLRRGPQEKSLHNRVARTISCLIKRGIPVEHFWAATAFFYNCVESVAMMPLYLVTVNERLYKNNHLRSPVQIP